MNIYSWLNSILQPYKEKAIKNANNHPLRELNQIYTVPSLDEALIGAFDFTNTPEGLEYWWDFYQTTLKPQQREINAIPTQRD